MNRRKVLKLLLLGSASVTSLVSYKWVDRLRNADVSYLMDKKGLLAELAETIIPETDTPGARAVRAEELMMRMLLDCTDARSLSNFILGLQDLEEFSFKHYKASFTACNAKDRAAILQEFENRAERHWDLLAKVENKLLGRPFFSLLKSYTITGFCTSMAGATQALQYQSIPGCFQNIGPIGPGQKSWATK